MHNYARLFNKILILPIAGFVVLVVFTVKMSDTLIFRSNDPVYSQYIPWDSESPNSSLLLHSIELQNSVLNAYDGNSKSIQQFPLKEGDIFYLSNIMKSYDYDYQACSLCHHKNK